MEKLPLYIGTVFVLTTILTIYIFYKATKKSKLTLIIILAWLCIQSFVALSGFYTTTNTFPPRFAFLVLPPLILIVTLFITNKGRQYVDSLDIKTLTILQVIRVPIEFVLYWLFIHKTVSRLVTFEGNNFDIISGLTAPAIFYFGFMRKSLGKNVILVWNFICLALLINVVAYAVQSAPSVFQKLSFEQPTIAVLYFPFNWLPCCVVPLVLFSHLVTIRQLFRKRKEI